MNLRWDRLLETMYRRGADVALLIPDTPALLRIAQEWRPLLIPAMSQIEIDALVAHQFEQPHLVLEGGYAYVDFWYGDAQYFRAMAFGYPRSTSLVVSVAKPPDERRS